MLYNLYLYFIETSDTLYLIKGLPYEKAFEVAHKWFTAGENRDYMLVTKDSKPYSEDDTIIEVSLDWIESQ